MLSFIKKNKNIMILLIPGLIAFILALIPTLKYQWPLCWDIFYHVHMANLYLENGVTFFDSLTYAPYGRPIFYPPLFHFLLAFLSFLFKIGPFQVAKFLQPVFSFSLVLSFSYVGYKLYGLSVGTLAGFFLLFTEIFYRSALAIPETMALIFLSISVYLFYKSIENKNYKYAVIAGILAGLTLLTHSLTAGILVLIIFTFTILLKFTRKESIFKYFGIFLGIMLIIASFWWLPLLLKFGFVFHNPYSNLTNINIYLTTLEKNFSIPLIFILVSLIWLIEKQNKIEKKDILIISWFVIIILISSIYLLGIPILFDRIVNFATLPIVVLAALGLNYFKTIQNKIYYLLVFLVVVCSIFSAFDHSMNVRPVISDSQQDIANWFIIHGDNKTVAVCLADQIDPMIVSISGQPVSGGGYSPGSINQLNIKMYEKGTYTKEDLVNNNIGYIIIKSRAQNPPFSKLIYQNKDYNIFVVENSNSNNYNL